MLQATDRAPVLNPDLLRRLTAIHARKCKHTKNPCFLTHLDSGLGPHSNRLLLFRGEPAGFDLPMTSALVREALNGSSLCKPKCDPKSISKKLYPLVKTLISKVAAEKPRYYGGHELDVSTQEWNLTTENSNPLFDEKRKPAPFELLVNAHFRGHLQTLKLKTTNSESSALDPFVSFSSSPEVAAKFSNSSAGQGRIWIISIPEERLETIEGGECRGNLNQVGIYDLSDCMRPRIYKGEREFDAYLHAPSDSILGYFRR